MKDPQNALSDHPETTLERLEREVLQARQDFQQVFTNNRLEGHREGKRALDSARGKLRRAQARLAKEKARGTS